MTPDLYSLLRTVFLFGGGVMVGVSVGVIVVALLVAARDNDGR